ncbi:polysaccharide biosynthesis/export family protein [Pedobacter cryoconitis]|uniref:polysaccharide biosynthesis/export family protein n=1 Tax=Pedobacter cryoconitis TaxID=188932 RepID=UPI001609F151|nr:polysaccharide biosynthesis/export family protein [Pedobacter cryoconitis]MBB5647187.1 polysaccharide export outer membrane protein [Pedobacter cryoconitis]
MKTSVPCVIIVLAMLLLSSCTTQNLMSVTKKKSQVTDSIFAFNPNYEYRLEKDDKINISIWDHDDLSVGSIYGIYNSNEVYGKWLMLNAEGTVTVPKLGEVNLLGLTIPQAKEKLTKEFKKWIVNPIIEIKVLNKEVSILGELKTPGKYLLEKSNNTLIDIISRAGDFDFYANKKEIQIIRIVNNKPVTHISDLTKMDNYLASNIQLHPGDVIYVPSRKGKHWDKRVGSTIVPLASAISSIVLIWGILK